MISSVTSARPALPALLRAPLGAVSALAAVVTVVVAVLLGGQSTGSPFDEWVLSAIGGPLADPSEPFTPAWIIGSLGDPVVAAVLVVILAVICWRMGRNRLAVLAVAGTASTGVVTTVLKPVIGRTINGPHLSYPSGHTALLTGLGIVVGLLLVDRFQTGRVASMALVLTLAVVTGVSMAWAQVALGVHYATDTVGGFCAALVLVPAVAWLIDRIADRR